MRVEEMIFGSLVVALAATLVVIQGKRFERIARAFRVAADARGGKVSIVDRGKHTVEATAEVRGTRVIARWCGRHAGFSATTVWAESPEAGDLDILVRPRRGLTAAHEASLGVISEVVTNDEMRARAWLDKATASAIKKAHGYRFRLTRGRAEAMRAGPERDPELLMAVIDALARFATPTGKTSP